MYIKFKKTHAVSKALALSLALVLTGCSKATDIDRLTEHYSSSGDEQYGYDVIELVNTILFRETHAPLLLFDRRSLYRDEKFSLIALSSAALSKEHYKLFADSYFFHVARLSDDEMVFLSDNYAGKGSRLNDLIARWHIKNNRVRSAFRRLETAALAGHENAQDAVRYTLEHFGCMDTASIWAERSTKQYKSMSQYDAGGDKYPPIPATLSREELVDLRVKLRNGSPPTLQSDCPIHKFS